VGHLSHITSAVKWIKYLAATGLLKIYLEEGWQLKNKNIFVTLHLL
jgi:hypothetical protein